MPGYLRGYVDRIAATAGRLQRVSLECRPALEVIGKYGTHPDVLLYIDLATTTAAKHRIRWWVYAGDERIPHTAMMRGIWGYDATCSCGWQTTTGGGTHGFVEDLVTLHKYEHGGVR